jgi:amino acid permease
MGIIVRMLFGLCLVAAPIVVWTTSAQLPARVASHFARGGYANGFMSHDAYVLFMLAMTTVLPLVVVACVGLIPRIATSRMSIRYREHWLAPERRAATLATLATWGCAFGIVLIVFLTCIHLLTLEANLRTPARLDESQFFTVLVGFLVMLAVWIGFLAFRFGRPGGR